MISNHTTLIDQKRQSAVDISAQVAQFLAADGRIQILESPPFNPEPPKRSKNIDPETVLKRKPKGLTLAERRALKRMADALL
ncbi:hypothetical protein ACRZ5O_22730 [Pseudomonas protegens]|uniref:hypothetical protein n=1 Tax=Pseudomonas protegens TaxID=380021 RepID=UPI003FD73638